MCFFLIGKSSCTKFRWGNKGFTPIVLFPLVLKLLPQYRPKTKKKTFYEITHLYMGNMQKVCRTAFAVYKLHNLTKILLIAHITQMNFSKSNFYSNGEIWNSSIQFSFHIHEKNSFKIFRLLNYNALIDQTKA